MDPLSHAVLSSANCLLGHHLLHAGTPTHRPTHHAATASPNATTIAAQWVSSSHMGKAEAHPVHTSLALTGTQTKTSPWYLFLLPHPGQRGRTGPVFALMTQPPQHGRQGPRAPGSLRQTCAPLPTAAHCRQDHACLGTDRSGRKPPISSTPALRHSSWHMALISQYLPRHQCESRAWHWHRDSPSPRSYSVSPVCQGGPFLPITTPLLRSYWRDWEVQRREAGTHTHTCCRHRKKEGKNQQNKANPPTLVSILINK